MVRNQPSKPAPVVEDVDEEMEFGSINLNLQSKVTREKPFKSGLLRKSKLVEKVDKVQDEKELRSSVIRIPDGERTPVCDEEFDDLEDIRLATESRSSKVRKTSPP